MSSPSSFDLVLRPKGSSENGSGSARDDGLASSTQSAQAVQSRFENTDTTPHSQRSATTTQDPQEAQSVAEVTTIASAEATTAASAEATTTVSAETTTTSSAEITTTTPSAEEATTTSGAQQPKGVKFAPHITLISHEGESKRVPWNPFASQTSIEPLDGYHSFVSENSSLGSNSGAQQSQLTLAEFLSDDSNLPPHLRSRPSIHDSAQGSVVSLNTILAEGPPAPPAAARLQRSVSERVADKVRSLAATGSKKTTTSSSSSASSSSAVSVSPPQQEALTSIGLGLDGSYLFEPPPPPSSPISHHPLSTPLSTVFKPLPPLPPQETGESQDTAQPAPPPPPPPPTTTTTTTSTRPRTRGRSRNATIRPSYEVITPYLPRERSDSNETIKAGPTSETIGIMNPSVDDTDRVERIPLVCPAWDRRIDLTWTREEGISWSGARELLAFQVSLEQLRRDEKHIPTKTDLTNPLLRLPDRIRYEICKYLVQDGPNQMPIRLNNGMRLYEPAWPAVYFESLADVLDSVSNYTSVCWAMRRDFLATIMNTRQFHVVLSPFSGSLLDPISNCWFVKYAGYIQHITIEIDYTKLGFGGDPGTVNLKPLVTKVVPRVEQYGVAQKKRAIQQQLLTNQPGLFAEVGRGGGGHSTVHSLTLAVRRYFGERPAEAGRVPQKYSPDEYLAVLGPVKALCGKVDEVRAVGLDADSTHRLLALVWEGMTAESVKAAVAGRFGAVRATCPSDFYPTLPGQASFFDDGMSGNSGSGVFVRHPFSFDDGRLGFHLDESMIGAEREGKARSSIPPSALGGKVGPAAQRVKGLPGSASGRDKGKGKAKMGEGEKEAAPEWPETEGWEVGSCGSLTETEPFPELPDADLQLALLEAYEVGEALRESAERCPSPQRQQGEAAEESMPGASRGGVMGRVAGRLQRGLSQLNLKDKSSRE